MKGILMKEQRETRILANQCDYRRSAVFGPTATVAKQDV